MIIIINNLFSKGKYNIYLSIIYRIKERILAFNDFNNTLNTILQLEFKNDFVSKTVKIKTDIRNELNKKKHPISGRDSKFIYVIVFSVVLFLLLTGILLFKCYKKKRNKKKMELDILL